MHQCFDCRMDRQGRQTEVIGRSAHEAFWKTVMLQSVHGPRVEQIAPNLSDMSTFYLSEGGFTRNVSNQQYNRRVGAVHQSEQLPQPKHDSLNLKFSSGCLTIKLREIVPYVFFDASVRSAVTIICSNSLLAALPAASMLLHSSNTVKTKTQTGRESTDDLIGVPKGNQIGVPIGIV
jgi:hypothetical protein